VTNGQSDAKPAIISPPPKSIATATWSVVISYPAKGRRLSWYGWLVTQQDLKWSTVSVLPGLDVKYLYLRQGGYVIVIVCLFVSNFVQKSS